MCWAVCLPPSPAQRVTCEHYTHGPLFPSLWSGPASERPHRRLEGRKKERLGQVFPRLPLCGAIWWLSLHSLTYNHGSPPPAVLSPVTCSLPCRFRPPGSKSSPVSQSRPHGIPRMLPTPLAAIPSLHSLLLPVSSTRPWLGHWWVRYTASVSLGFVSPFGGTHPLEAGPGLNDQRSSARPKEALRDAAAVTPTC